MRDSSCDVIAAPHTSCAKSWSMGCGFMLLGLSAVTLSAAVTPPVDEMVARYERAAEIQQAQSRHWLLNQAITPHWITGRDAFWYERETLEGHRFTQVDAASGARSDAFDHAALARSLGHAVAMTLDPNELPIKGLRLDPAKGTLQFFAFGMNWLFDGADVLREVPDSPSHFSVSPDKKQGIYLKDHNLWVKNFDTGSELRLTADGEAHYSYGTDPEAQLRPILAPKVVWSPDSKHIFTAQTDDRQVLDAPVVDFAPKDGLRPKVVHYREAFPGDLNVPMFRLVMIDIGDGSQTPVKYPTIPAVRMNDSPMGTNRMWWSADGNSAYFVDIERGEKAVHVEAVDARSGATREVFSETNDMYVELGTDVYSPATIRPLAKTSQVIWYSERSGWGHLYLYDLTNGRVIRALTTGKWVVRNILEVDEEHRQVFVSVAGRTRGRNPYYQEVARVDLDSGGMTILSASDDDHEVVVPGSLSDSSTVSYVFAGGDPKGLQGVAPSGNYFVETVTTADKPSRTLLRNRDGRVIATVEIADGSQMPASWRWPKPVKLISADGNTEIYGVVFRPSDHDRNKKYPVIDYIYGAPQTSYVPKGFAQGDYQDAASLAELGFVTLMIDGRGTTQRSRAFHTESYGKLETASNLEDHIAGIRQLAVTDQSIDTSQVGITGFSGGGYMAAGAMLRFPEFFKVGVAASGDHDQRLFWHSWGERYEGYPVGDYYRQQANSIHANNLKGNLLLVHGLLDTAVNPSSLFQLEQSLIDSNKDFDLLLWPRAHHEFPSYGKRRQWDYFVEHLAHKAPPHEFLLRTDSDIENDKEEMAAAVAKANAVGPIGGNK